MLVNLHCEPFLYCYFSPRICISFIQSVIRCIALLVCYVCICHCFHNLYFGSDLKHSIAPSGTRDQTRQPNVLRKDRSAHERLNRCASSLTNYLHGKDKPERKQEQQEHHPRANPCKATTVSPGPPSWSMTIAWHNHSGAHLARAPLHQTKTQSKTCFLDVVAWRSRSESLGQGRASRPKSPAGEGRYFLVQLHLDLSALLLVLSCDCVQLASDRAKSCPDEVPFFSQTEF